MRGDRGKLVGGIALGCVSMALWAVVWHLTGGPVWFLP